jgi:CubicO group peptidase (beta-lactamase class C family)
VIFRKGYGLANVEHNVLITLDTLFRIASMTRKSAAIPILILMDRGRLELDDCIAGHLPE